MEYRKIIGFGRSSFVISLPKSWITKNNLKKGDLVYLEEKGSDITFSTQAQADEEKEVREFVHDVSGRESWELTRHIIPAYINNYNSIRIKGKDLTLKAPKVKQLLSELMAMEIMEETKDMIVARDFISMKKVSIPTLIRKMDNITRGMFSDCVNMADRPEILESLTERDKNVNRLSYLIFRSVKFGLTNPSASKAYNLSNEELLKLWLLTDKIETIADHVKRVSRLLAKAELDKDTKDKVVDICRKIDEFYKKNMKGFYSKDYDLLYQCVREKKEIYSNLDEILESSKHQKYLPNIIERLKMKTGQINGIAWLTFGR